MCIFSISRLFFKETFLIESNNNKEMNKELNLTYKNKSDSSDLKKQLTSTYGLKLVDSVADIEHLRIDFENK